MQIIPAVMFAATIMLAASALAYSEEYQFIRDKTGDIDWAAECKRRPSVAIGMTEVRHTTANGGCLSTSTQPKLLPGSASNGSAIPGRYAKKMAP